MRNGPAVGNVHRHAVTATGAARTLLLIADRNPQALLDVGFTKGDATPFGVERFERVQAEQHESGGRDRFPRVLSELVPFGDALADELNLGLGMLFEVFAAVVIGGVSLKGGVGRLSGVFAGVLLPSIVAKKTPIDTAAMTYHLRL